MKKPGNDLRRLMRVTVALLVLASALNAVAWSVAQEARWNSINIGLTGSLDVRTLAIDPVNTGTIYAGSRAGVFKSTDSGGSWHPSALAGNMEALKIDSANPNILYAGIVLENSCHYANRRLFKSADGGATWSDGVSPPINGCDHIHSMELTPTEPNTLYVANFDDLNWDTWTPLIKSTDGGGSWIPLYGPPFATLAIDPLHPKTLYAGTFDSPYYGYGGAYYGNGVLKSTDGGEHWNVTGLTKTGVNAVAIDPINPNTIYAATSDFRGWPQRPNNFRGLFKSLDSGESWISINNGLSHLIGSSSSIDAIVIHPSNPNILYAGTSGSGVFKSFDGGAHWSPFNDGLNNLDVRTLALAEGSRPVLYAATAGGVFKITDLNLAPSGTVTNVSAASFRMTGLPSESIAVSFGTSLSTVTQSASSSALPTSLGGTTVKVRDSAGIERLAPLFYVSPTQVNYLIPRDTAIGTASVTVTSEDNKVSIGLALINAVAPSLFGANGNGAGAAAAVALRLKAGGSQSYEPVVMFDSARKQFATHPLDLGPEGDQVYLLLFGTGIRHRSLVSSVVATIGGSSAEVSFAGAHDDFVGVDQINVLVPRNLAGSGEVEVILTVEGQMANPVRVNVK